MASGDTLVVLLPMGYEPPASNYATIDTRGAHPVLDFDAGTEEAAMWTAYLPKNYAGGGLTVSSFWAFSSDTSGTNTIQVGADIERMNVSSSALPTEAFGGVNSATSVGTPTTTGQFIKVDVTFDSGADMDSLAADELFRLEITRIVANAGDTATGDAELVGVVVKER